MKQIITLIALLTASFSQTVFGQTNYLANGNKYLANEKYSAAERVFREAVKADSSNLIYQCQLALSLTQQSKYEEANHVIDKVLSKDPSNIGALWYGGVNGFSNEKAEFRKTISYFERVLPLLKENQGQFYSANWFIGKSYQNLLQTTGISYDEASRMLECYALYVRLQPNAEDASKIAAFVQHIKEIRPPNNVKLWVNK
ncbi:tetratricopeptide repeat protein [Hymenobacter ruber]